MVFSNQAIVPSPPATRIVLGVFPNKRHHSRAATGSRSAKSTTCAGFNSLLKSDKIWPPSLFPDFLFPTKYEEKIDPSSYVLYIICYWFLFCYLPTTMIGFQLDQFGGKMERRCSLRLIVLRRFITSKLFGGIIISLNFPKSHIWRSIMIILCKLFHGYMSYEEKISLIITSERAGLQASWTLLWHQQHHQSVRPGSISHSSSQM